MCLLLTSDIDITRQNKVFYGIKLFLDFVFEIQGFENRNFFAVFFVILLNYVIYISYLVRGIGMFGCLDFIKTIEIFQPQTS